MENLTDFKIATENILTSFKGGKYVYNKTEKRVFQRVGPINHESELFDDHIPTLSVDLDGDKCNFTILRGDNTFEVLSLPDGFDYIEYVKNL
jgi:hypothetical protein